MHRLGHRPDNIDSSLTGADLLPADSLTSPPSVALAGAGEGVLLTGLAWVTAGLLVAVFMIRRGHDAGAWSLLGIAFGPLLLGLAVHWIREREPSAEPVVLAGAKDHGGTTDVLIGLGRSGQDPSFALPEIESLGSELGRLTVACSVDFESMLDEEDGGAMADAAVLLQRAAIAFIPHAPGLVILPGQIDRAATRYAEAEQIERVFMAP